MSVIIRYTCIWSGALLRQVDISLASNLVDRELKVAGLRRCYIIQWTWSNCFITAAASVFFLEIYWSGLCRGARSSRKSNFNYNLLALTLDFVVVFGHTLNPWSMKTPLFGLLSHQLQCWTRGVNAEIIIELLLTRLKRSFCEISTSFLTPYREFDQRPHMSHTRQLIFKLSVWSQKNLSRRVTSTLAKSGSSN
jgi:hypothetical protein